MARRPDVDGRQADFFGAPAPTSAAPVRRPASKPGPEQDAKHRASLDSKGALQDSGPGASTARMSPAELSELVAALPDDALAYLVLAAFRQLRRRLARGGGRGGKGRASALERSARQLIAELGSPGEADDDWGA